jgi:hypothetical protein
MECIISLVRECIISLCLFEVVEAEAVGPESEEDLQVRIVTGPNTTGFEYPSRIAGLKGTAA